MNRDDHAVGPPSDLLLAALARHPVPDWGALGTAGWEAMTAAATGHGVLALLRHRLQESGATPFVPPDVQALLERAHTVAALRADAARLQRDDVMRALRAADVPALLLKGADLAARAYPSPALRPMGDLDLLVPAGRTGDAMAALAAAGYTLPTDEEWAAFHDHRHPPPLRRAGYLPVELHEAIEPCAPPFTLPVADVWARARPGPTGDELALALAPEDLLLHLATHMGYSHLLGTSLVRAYDVAVWLERFGAETDWDALAARAGACGVRRFVAASLGLADRLFGVAAPAPMRAALSGTPAEAVRDAAAVATAVALLRLPVPVLVGVTPLMPRDAGPAVRARRLTRAARVAAELLGGTPLSQAQGALRHPAGQPRLWARLRALARLLTTPTALPLVAAQARRAARLRRWAEQPSPT